jgi:hypothetical protein
MRSKRKLTYFNFAFVDCFTTLSVARLHTIYSWDDRWVMNWKGLERKLPSPGICIDGIRKTTNRCTARDANQMLTNSGPATQPGRSVTCPTQRCSILSRGSEVERWRWSCSCAQLIEYACWSGGIAPPFLKSALDGGKWSASRPGRFTAGGTTPVPIG